MLMTARTALLRPSQRRLVAPLFLGGDANSVTGGTVGVSFSAAGLQVNDVLFIWQAGTAIGPLNPSGWTILYNTGQLYVGYQVCSASPPSSVSFSSGGGTFGQACGYLAFRNVDGSAGTAKNFELASATGGSGAPNPPSQNLITFDDTLVVCFAGCDSSGTPGGGSLSGYTTIGAGGNGSTNDGEGAGSYRNSLAKQGDEVDPPAYVGWSSSGWNAITLQLAPTGSEVK